MFPNRWFPLRFFARRYWPRPGGGTSAAPIRVEAFVSYRTPATFGSASRPVAWASFRTPATFVSWRAD